MLLNGSVVLLLGAFLIGWIGAAGAERQLSPFISGIFPGALCLFLLDMGLTAARRLRDRGRGLDSRLVGFAVVMPLLGGARPGLARGCWRGSRRAGSV